MRDYVIRDNKRLRIGYTTGTCAAAAAKAATMMLLSGKNVDTVTINTPGKVRFTLEVRKIHREVNQVSCAIKKDAGDDVDATNGVLVYATVLKISDGIIIDGGTGIGRVTKEGLDQPIGAAAINTVPRQMIKQEVTAILEEAEYTGGIKVIISIPDGVLLAEKTFNPMLGITGGISILGTSGIVEPMSEKAIVETIHIEMNMLAAKGLKYVVVTPGNYGESYVHDFYADLCEQTIKSSNFIGETIDMGYEFSLQGMLFIGNIGKLVKLAAGVMNTHSRYADTRMEVLVCSALLAGATTETLKQIYTCVSTDEALGILQKEQLLPATMKVLLQKIEYHLTRRSYDGMKIGAILFSSQYGYLGETSQVPYLIEQLRKSKKEMLDKDEKLSEI